MYYHDKGSIQILDLLQFNLFTLNALNQLLLSAFINRSLASSLSQTFPEVPILAINKM